MHAEFQMEGFGFARQGGEQVAYKRVHRYAGGEDEDGNSAFLVRCWGLDWKFIFTS